MVSIAIVAEGAAAILNAMDAGPDVFSRSTTGRSRHLAEAVNSRSADCRSREDQRIRLVGDAPANQRDFTAVAYAAAA
jgi:hypothetical protein